MLDIYSIIYYNNYDADYGTQMILRFIQIFMLMFISHYVLFKYSNK